MNVLIQSYNTCIQNQAGGVQHRIRKTVSALREKGVSAEYFNQFESNVALCDILHVFGYTCENLGLIRCAKAYGKKVVISPVAPLINGRKIDFYRMLSHFPIQTTYKLLIQSIQLADLVIVETKKEADFIRKHYRIPLERIEIIPNGAEEITVADESVFDAIGKKCKYILHVGRFDENKNQINVIKAMRKTNIDVVFAGGASHMDLKYYDLCKKEAEGYANFHFLGWLDADSPLLRSAYANADTFVMPSYYETFGLVIVEAGIAGAKLALSSTLPILDYEAFKDCKTFNPADITEMRECIMEVINMPANATLANRIKHDFSWKAVAQKHSECYEGLLK